MFRIRACSAAARNSCLDRVTPRTHHVSVINHNWIINSDLLPIYRLNRSHIFKLFSEQLYINLQRFGRITKLCADFWQKEKLILIDIIYIYEPEQTSVRRIRTFPSKIFQRFIWLARVDVGSLIGLRLSLKDWRSNPSATFHGADGLRIFCNFLRGLCCAVGRARSEARKLGIQFESRTLAVDRSLNEWRVDAMCASVRTTV